MSEVGCVSIQKHPDEQNPYEARLDVVSSNPKFNWDSADLVGEWKAFRQHVEFMFKGRRTKKSDAVI